MKNLITNFNIHFTKEILSAQDKAKVGTPIKEKPSKTKLN